MSHLPSQKTASQRVLELGLFAVVIGKVVSGIVSNLLTGLGSDDEVALQANVPVPALIPAVRLHSKAA